MKRTLIISLAGLVLVLAGCSLNTPNANQNINQIQPQTNNEQNDNLPVVDQNQNINSPVVENNNTNTVKQQVPTPSTTVTTPAPVPQVATSDYLWSLFDKLNETLKNNNIVAYNSIVYAKVLPVEEKQFSQLATYIYDENIKINKANFVNKWQDDKQAIFSTNPIKDTKNDNYQQERVSFVKSGGSWKVLIVGSKAGDLAFMTPDSDKDGLSDREETCSGASQYDPDCVKTDPNKRDTNNNGWWDGIEIDMK